MYYGLQLKSIGLVTPAIQIIIIAVFFVITTALYYREYRSTGKISKCYPLHISMLFAPIYEEIIFRGFILYGLLQTYSVGAAVITSSILFGIWHFKNIFFLPKNELIWQMIYTGIIFGPIMALVTLWTGSIWIAVILHFCNNIVAPYTQKIIKK